MLFLCKINEQGKRMWSGGGRKNVMKHKIYFICEFSMKCKLHLTFSTASASSSPAAAAGFSVSGIAKFQLRDCRTHTHTPRGRAGVGVALHIAFWFKTNFTPPPHFLPCRVAMLFAIVLHAAEQLQVTSSSLNLCDKMAMLPLHPPLPSSLPIPYTCWHLAGAKVVVYIAIRNKINAKSEKKKNIDNF